MGSIQSVQGASSAALAAAAVAKQVSQKTQTAKPEAAAQEAQESVAVTRSEAAKGDQQAIRKLANSQTASSPEKVENPAAEGNNSALDIRG